MSRLLRPALLGLILLFLWPAAFARAHRVNIFAWLEEDAVQVECGFNRSSPVRDGAIKVLDAATGALLLEGRTDDAGKFSFPAPEAARRGHGLRLLLDAGEGHAARWDMEAEEFASLRGEPGSPPSGGIAGWPEAKMPAGVPEEGTSPDAPGQPTAPAGGQPATSAEVAAIVREALAPVQADLAALRARLSAPDDPGLKEILGGLGWIAGFIGLWIGWRARRGEKKK